MTRGLAAALHPLATPSRVAACCSPQVAPCLPRTHAKRVSPYAPSCAGAADLRCSEAPAALHGCRGRRRRRRWRRRCHRLGLRHGLRLCWQRRRQRGGLAERQARAHALRVVAQEALHVLDLQARAANLRRRCTTDRKEAWRIEAARVRGVTVQGLRPAVTPSSPAARNPGKACSAAAQPPGDSRGAPAARAPHGLRIALFPM
jgi:hypothetical protein